MKSFTKLLLLTAVAVMAVAVSVAPSEAAKKKAKAAKAVSDCAMVGQWCTMGGTNVQHYCGANKKWTPIVLPACTWAGCPPPCS